MNLSRATLLAHARSDAGRRAIRYSATSLVAVAGTQILLAFFLHILDLKPLLANFIAVTLMSVPAFILNKRWVWGKRGKAHMRREVLPFWLFTVAGWILSTLAVALIVEITKTPTNPDGNKLAVQGANIAGFGVLWVLKYVFLDKIMFGAHHHTPYDEDIEVEEALEEQAEEAQAIAATGIVEPGGPRPAAATNGNGAQPEAAAVRRDAPDITGSPT